MRTRKSGVEHLAQHPGWKTKRRKPKVKPEHLDASDVATILAALRLFQREYKDMDAVEIAEAWPDHFEQNTDDHWSSPNGCHEDCPVCADPITPMPLGTEDIDTLCERINTARLLEVPS